MDEPFTGISFEARKELMGLVKDVLVGRLGATVLLATHVLRDAERLSNRYIFLRQGKLVAQGDLSSLKRRLKLREKVRMEVSLGHALLEETALEAGVEDYKIGVGERGYTLEFLAEDSGAVLPGLLAAIHSRGGKVFTVNVSEPSLEEVYMELFGKKWEAPAAGGGEMCSLVVA